jgi:serine/threonine-protein kinase RsbW
MTAAALPSPPTTGDVVELTVPASPAYVTVVRTATAGLAARVDITVDRIEDLRIAVDEACALLVRGANHQDPHADRVGSAQDALLGADGVLRCRFVLHEESLTIVVQGPATQLPEPDSFAWSVLSALVDALETGHGAGPEEETADPDDGTWLRLVVRRGTGSWS